MNDESRESGGGNVIGRLSHLEASVEGQDRALESIKENQRDLRGQVGRVEQTATEIMQKLSLLTGRETAPKQDWVPIAALAVSILVAMFAAITIIITFVTNPQAEALTEERAARIAAEERFIATLREVTNKNAAGLLAFKERVYSDNMFIWTEKGKGDAENDKRSTDRHNEVRNDINRLEDRLNQHIGNQP